MKKSISNSKLQLKPTAGYALIKPLEIEKQTATGIILPDTHDEKSQRGTVLAMGGPLINDKGQKITAEFKVGDEVIYKKWGGEELKLGISGKEMVFVKFDDLQRITENSS